MIKLTLLLVVMLAVACKEDTVSAEERGITLAATYKGVGGDCNLPLLSFDERKSELDKFTGIQTTFDSYYALGIDTGARVIGDKIMVTARKTTDAEKRSCTTRGPNYAFIYVTNVK